MNTLSEDHILEILSRHFPDSHSSLILGRGDDCAVIKPQGQLCVSTDLFIEDVHFRQSYFTPGEIGHKALAVNISDIAAMGVRPTGFSLGLAIPENTSMQWLDAFFFGMGQLARTHNVALSGGDISRADKVHICITNWGEVGANKALGDNGSPYLVRGGAMPGDVIFIVGQVGLARVGLEELEKNGRDSQDIWPFSCAAHLRPEPQVDAGLILARSSINVRPPVLMDLSDGLARDLPRLLGREKNSMLGAQIVFPDVLLHQEVIEHARKHKRNAVHEAWLGGEDYALLGACMPKLLPILQAALPQMRSIGIVTDSGHIELNGDRVDFMGFDHFNRK